MTLKVFNTLTRQKEVFKPINDNKVNMYSCGPTVYHYAHIGNLRTYIFNDILRKTLKYLNYDLTHVMNITDVGHIVGDADQGEDKMLKGAIRENKTVWQIAQQYTDAFMNDIKRLNIESPDHILKATDNIKEMQDIISTLVEKDYAYIADGNVYFDTSKFDGYEKLGKLNLENLREGARVCADSNKRNSTDFVLWFTKSKFQDQDMKWDSPWGVGYPGWHIECTAMSSKHFGNQFDIHTGGVDHIPVHHTNEIAQSEAAFGVKPWVNYWIHGAFLIDHTGKMSKSKGEFLTLQLLVDKGYDPLAYRYFCLNAHYRQQLTFSFEALDAAKTGFNTLKYRIIELKKNVNDNNQNHDLEKSYKDEFIEAISDDLNMPRALATFQKVLKDNNISNKQKYNLILDFDKVLGLNVDSFKEEAQEISPEIMDIIKERELARQNKDWAKSDELRDLLKGKGVLIKDTKEGTKWELI